MKTIENSFNNYNILKNSFVGWVEEKMADLLTFTLIFIPVALLIGVATAAISYTAWSLVVPIAFMMFGFDMFDALFLSILVDLADSIIMNIFFFRSKTIDFKKSITWSIPALIGGLVGFFFAITFLEQNSDLLKGSAGYVIILLGIGFVYKGYKGLKNSDEDEGENTEKEFLPNKVAVPLAIFGIFISGVIGGLLGMGSGTNFVLVLMILIPGYSLKKATGTGAFIMALLMLMCSFLYYPLVNIDFLIPYILVSISFSMIGTSIAAKYALKLSKHKLNITVGVVMILAATVATILSLSFA